MKTAAITRLLTFRVVDEEKRREPDARRLLSDSLAMAEKSSRIKNKFLSRMSRDLHSPINDIMGMLEIAQFLLENAGMVVSCARNGQEAVDIFRQSGENKFDVILMDIMASFCHRKMSSHMTGLDISSVRIQWLSLFRAVIPGRMYNNSDAPCKNPCTTAAVHPSA